MKEYELLYIVPTQYTDPEIEMIQSQIAKLLEDQGAKILRNENLGKIRLAYPIGAQHHGSYILVHFDCEATALTEINRKLGLTDEILRHTLLVRASGALEKKFELSSYVAPLSEEAKKERDASPRRSTRISHGDEGFEEKPVFKKAPARPLPPPPPMKPEPAGMTMEELDEKLDKILEGDIADNI